MKQPIYTFISGIIFLGLLGCATETKEAPAKSSAPAPQAQPAQPAKPVNQVTTTMLGDMASAPDFVKNPQNGEFVHIGREYIDDTGFQNPNQVKFPAYHRWYAKLEFLKQDGTKVDAASWNRPYGEHHLIRITLESSAAPGKRYVVTESLYFLYRTGSIQGGQYMVGLDDKQKPIFEISLTNKLGMPSNFQLWDFIQTSGGNLQREFGVNTLVLTETNAKHVILFY